MSGKQWFWCGIGLAALTLAIQFTVQASGPGLTTALITQEVERVETVVQLQSASLHSLVTGTTTLPFDDTIPQSTEGNEILTVLITPRSATNLLVVTFTGNSGHTLGVLGTAALFRDSVADAVAATPINLPALGTSVSVSLRHVEVAGSTNPTTFKVRIGYTTVGTAYVNGLNQTTRSYGGVASTTLTVTEYRP